MDDLIHEFVAETNESLGLLDQEIVKFEQNPNDADILSRIFRVMHTIKGTCGFLGLARLEKVAHAGEDVLGKFRDGALGVSPEAVTLILRCLDRIRELVQALDGAGVEPEGDDSALVADLRAMADGKAVAAVIPAPQPSAAPASDGPVLGEGGFPVAKELLDEVAAAQPEAQPEPVKPAPVVQEAAPVKAPVAAAPAAASSGDKSGGQSIRVNVDVIENLMALVSEMVLTRNQLLQLNRTHGDSPFKGPVQRLNRVTTDLQESVMKTRMQPIGNAWNKLPRIVRDLANELGKKIDLVMHGEETELDRQVLELIRDPLTHMVRNSADHGLEIPADRAAAGKREVGTINLSAHHEGGHIIIEIADDGRGLNTDRIRAKIVERNLATPEELAAMDDNQVHQFIMKAGFSTAEKVTNVSGRGVGMDVVRSNIEKIGGTLEFRSAWGQGSTFTIKIPLTLAIVSALIVEAAGQRFAVPQIAVREVVRATGNSGSRIETLSGAPVLRLRDRLLPLLNLSNVLKIGGEASDSVPGQVVVCRSGQQIFGVVVDRIADAEEIVVKPMSDLTKGSGVFSGNTVLGDGTVILILDINTLSQRLNLEATKAAEINQEALAKTSAVENILLFRSGGDGVKGVPLSAVHRIEHFAMPGVEWTQGNPVIQYRDSLLPLVSIDGPAGIRREGHQHVLVFADDDRAIGLAIEKLEDIVTGEVRMSPSRVAGIAGSQIVGGRAVDYVDPAFFLAAAEPAQASTIISLGEAA